MCNKVFYTTKEVSAMIGVPESTLRWWTQEQYDGTNSNRLKLQPHLIGHRYYYHRPDVEQFIEEVIADVHKHR